MDATARADVVSATCRAAPVGATPHAGPICHPLGALRYANPEMAILPLGPPCARFLSHRQPNGR
jgi:hypothetical protein